MSQRCSWLLSIISVPVSVIIELKARDLSAAFETPLGKKKLQGALDFGRNRISLEVRNSK